MGFFDWLRGRSDWDTDDGSEIPASRQLTAASSVTTVPDVKPTADKAAAQAPGNAAAPAKTAAPAPAAAPAEDEMPDFGIQKAIELIRDLPSKDSDAVVQAVCKTLESLGIEVPDIIAQAKDKQDGITKRIKNLRDEIKDLEEEIAGRKQEISALEADHKETGEVRTRLEKATVPGKAEPADSKPAAAAKTSNGAPKPAVGQPAVGQPPGFGTIAGAPTGKA